MRKTIPVLLSLSALLSLCVTATYSDTTDDERYEKSRETNTLLDRQNVLLDKENKLAKHVHELKTEIGQLHRELDNSQSDLESVRHELIILKVKLMN